MLLYGNIIPLPHSINLNQLIINVLSLCLVLRNMTVLMELSLPSVDTIVFNSRVLFAHHYSLSCNKIAQWFTDINIWLFVWLFGMHVFYCYILLLSLCLSLSFSLVCLVCFMCFMCLCIFFFSFSFAYYGPCGWNKDMMMMMIKDEINITKNIKQLIYVSDMGYSVIKDIKRWHQLLSCFVCLGVVLIFIWMQ